MLGTICEQCGKPTTIHTTECIDCMTRIGWEEP